MKSKFLILCAIAAFVTLLCPSLASATPVDLGAAQSFAVLAGTTVTNTGPTKIYGDLGVSPGSEITGFQAPPANTVVGGTLTGFGAGLATGTIHITDTAAANAQTALTTAYNALAALPFTTHYTIPTDLGGLTLTPGVYKFDSSAGLTGILTLNFTSNPTGNFVFQIGTTLTTAPGSVGAPGSSVNVIDGSTGSGVYWQVGSSATLDTYTAFAGNILALTSISLNTGATILNGRALARNGAVTMQSNVIGTVPIPATMLLLGSGLAGLVAFRKRFKKA